MRFSSISHLTLPIVYHPIGHQPLHEVAGSVMKRCAGGRLICNKSMLVIESKPVNAVWLCERIKIAEAGDSPPGGLQAQSGFGTLGAA